nr:hypothetical protein [Tanacetum cinerariifolium]
HSHEDEYLGEVKDACTRWVGEPQLIEAFYKFLMMMKRIKFTLEKRNVDPRLRNRCRAEVPPLRAAHTKFRTWGYWKREDVKGWLFRCQQFFKLDNVEKEEKLARMQEAAKVMLNKRYTPLLTTPKHLTSTIYANRNITYHARPPTTKLALPSTPFNKTATIVNTPQKRRLSQKEYEEKRSKNLCFYCDQKCVPCHTCSGLLFSIEFLADDEVQKSMEEVEECLEEEVIEKPVVYPHISLNALAGVNDFYTMRIEGHVGKHDIHILVNSGRTHNFVDVQCAKKLGCERRSIYPLQI